MKGFVLAHTTTPPPPPCFSPVQPWNSKSILQTINCACLIMWPLHVTQKWDDMLKIRNNLVLFPYTIMDNLTKGSTKSKHILSLSRYHKKMEYIHDICLLVYILTNFFIIRASLLPFWGQIWAICTHRINAKIISRVLFTGTIIMKNELWWMAWISSSPISTHSSSRPTNYMFWEVKHVIGNWMTCILQMNTDLRHTEIERV